MTFLIDGATVVFAAMFAFQAWRQACKARDAAARAGIAVALARQAQRVAEGQR